MPTSSELLLPTHSEAQEMQGENGKRNCGQFFSISFPNSTASVSLAVAEIQFVFKGN